MSLLLNDPQFTPLPTNPPRTFLSGSVLSLLLAVALAGMVVLSLVVNSRVAGYELMAAAGNERIALDLRLVSGLRDLAVAINTPGNEVFLTNAIDLEAARLEEAFRRWEEQVQETEGVLRADPIAVGAPAVERDLARARTSAEGMRMHATAVFAAMRRQRRDEAGRHMAQMDQMLFSTLGDLQALRNDLTDAQDSLLRAERASAESSDRLLRWAAVVMLLLAVGGGWFGHRLARLAERQAIARERTMQEVARGREALEAAHVELTMAHRELETFSSSVAHDLRAPIRSVQGFSQALQEDLGDRLAPAEAAHLEHIRTAAATMTQLIEDLLALAHVSSRTLVRVPLDLTALAGEVVAELRAQEPGREVEVRIAPGLQTPADPGLARLLLQNLLGNAWKFTRHTVDARVELFQEQEPGSRTPVFVVRDNGAGFSMDHAHRLFIAFQRLHSTGEFEGTGIGLATVQRIIRRHGGQISAVAVPRRGATFRFTLGAR